MKNENLQQRAATLMQECSSFQTFECALNASQDKLNLIALRTLNDKNSFQ